ncbi:MAG: DUF1254 domain-containing protein [Fimbriimonadaceae bacterium]|nr:DUF1254 domain-containing protein [Alphaproteobacteria bacterium]
MNRIGWIAAGLVLGIIVHIVSVLILPSMAQNDAWAKLSRYGSFNDLYLLPSATPQIEPVADMDPGIRYAICRFDLSTGPLKIVAAIPQTYWSLAIYDEGGSNYYTLNNRSAGRNTLTLWIANQRQILAMEPDDPENADDRLVVKSRGRYGIAMFRILIPDASFETIARSIFNKSNCAIDNSIVIPDE